MALDQNRASLFIPGLRIGSNEDPGIFWKYGDSRDKIMKFRGLNHRQDAEGKFW
jgi:hypothetical protein